MRFEEADIAFLQGLAWWDWPIERLRELGRHFSDVKGLRAAMGAAATPGTGARGA
jgi:hypothetical protein